MTKFWKAITHWRNLAVILLIILVTFVVTYMYYSNARTKVYDSMQKELVTICGLKEQQINEWVEGRFEELEYFADNPRMAFVIETYNKKQETLEIAEKTLAWLKSDREYDNVFILNSNKQLIYKVDSSSVFFNNNQINDQIDHTLYSGYRQMNVVWVPELNNFIIQFVLPITKPTTRQIIGLLIGQVDPRGDFSQMVNNLTTSYKTTEIFVAKTFADSVMVLTTIKNSPRKSQCIARASELEDPRQISLNAEAEIVSRVDYRGNKVLLHSEPLPLGGWSLICKVNTDEINSSIVEINVVVVIIILVLLSLSLLVMFFSSTVQDRLNLKKAIEREKNAVGRLSEYKFVMQNISCSVISVDKDNIIRFINPAACTLIGYPRVDCVGQPLTSVFVPTKIEGKHYLLINSYKAEYHIEINESKDVDALGEYHGRVLTFRDISDSVIQHEMLQKSYSLYNSMFENSPQPMFIYEIDGSRILQMNKAACELLKYQQDEVQSLAMFDIIHEDEFERLRNLTFAVKQGEWKFITKDRNIIYIEVFGHNVTFNDKLCRHLMFNDISDRKKTQDDLINSERRYRTLIEILPDALLLHKDNVITFANKSAVSLLNAKSYDEIIGKSLLEFFPAEDCADIMLRESTVRNSKGGVPLVERSLICIDKTIKSVETTTTFYSVDKNVGSQIILHDLTQRKEAQRQIIESEKRYRGLVEISPDAIFILKQRKIVFANQSAANLLGFSNVDLLIGQQIRDFLLENEIDSIIQRAHDVEFTKSFVPIVERKMRRVDGQLIDVESSLAYLNSDDGQVSFQVIIRDISKRKKMEAEIIEALQKAKESDRLKSSFLANFSHEIRTPINAIVGFADMLLHFEDLDFTCRNEYVTIIQKSSFRLLSVINDTIEISKIDSGAISLYNSPIIVSEFMTGVYNQQAGFALKKNLSFEFIPPVDQTLVIYTDSNKLTKILNNLISNSIKYTDEGGILFTAMVVGNSLQFRVKDTGIGIEPENSNLIFIRFQRIENPTTTREGGIGLGLPIAQAYAKLLNGEITFESRCGVGSEFTLTIPLTIPTEEQCINKEVKLPSTLDFAVLNNSSEAKILVVEDDDSNYRLLHDFIASMGYIETRACNGKEAVEKMKLNSKNIFLILMDIKMPIMDGYEAFIAIRSFNTTVPIVAQTAHALAEENIRIGELGFDGLITKPISKETLKAVIEKYFPQSNNEN